MRDSGHICTVRTVQISNLIYIHSYKITFFIYWSDDGLRQHPPRVGRVWKMAADECGDTLDSWGGSGHEHFDCLLGCPGT